MCIFNPANILLPNERIKLDTWSVIACDQFTSQAEYWERVRANVGEAPSSVNLIIPESELKGDLEEKAKKINHTMYDYLNRKIFSEHPNSYIYVERTMQNGSIRAGIVGAIDLEEYDYSKDSNSSVRATEATIVERLPARMIVRRNAPVELPHILVLCNDDKKILIESITEKKAELKKVYDFELMENGGHISGWLIDGKHVDAFEEALQTYKNDMLEKGAQLNSNMVFAVGDGNHSLATAKSCYEEIKKNASDDVSNHPARYALVELENIYAESQEFEPIHRIVKNVNTELLLKEIKANITAEDGYPVTWYCGEEQEEIYLDKNKHPLAVGVLQEFLDVFLKEHGGEIDYIHGNDVVQELAKQENSIGFILPAIEKNSLFEGVMVKGVLPRKTFSMGHAVEKRYYLEARKIREDV